MTDTAESLDPLRLPLTGERLIEAALFGLGAPVGGETQAHASLFVDRRLGPPAGPKPDRPRRHSRPARDQRTATGQQAIPQQAHAPDLRGDRGLGKAGRQSAALSDVGEAPSPGLWERT